MTGAARGDSVSTIDLDATAKLPQLEDPADDAAVAAPSAAALERAALAAELAALREDHARLTERLAGAEANASRHLEALRARESLASAENARVAELKAELAGALARVGTLEAERAEHAIALEELRAAERARPPKRALGARSRASDGKGGKGRAEADALRIRELESASANLGRALRAQTDAAHLATSQIAAVERVAGELRGRIRYLEHELGEAQGRAEEYMRAARSADAELTARSQPPAATDRGREEAERESRAAALAAELEALKGEHQRQTLLLEHTRGALGERDLQIRRLERNLTRHRERAGTQAAPLVPSIGVLMPRDGSPPWILAAGRRNRIGRAPENDICLNDASVSRHHALILAGGGGTFIEDLNSVNGVGINGRRVRYARLNHGDVIAIGSSRFEFDAAPRAAAEG